MRQRKTYIIVHLTLIFSIWPMPVQVIVSLCACARVPVGQGRQLNG
jgi:hypothetical protein